MLRQSDTSLSPAEKEDKEIEQRMKSVKERPHCRKYKPRRLDRSKRRQRIKTEDSDIQAPVKENPDLSKMAARLAAEPSEDIKALFNKRVEAIYKPLAEISTSLADAFHADIHEQFVEAWDNTGKQQEILRQLGDVKDQLKTEIKKYSRIFKKAGPDNVARLISDNWPEKSDWMTRAAVIAGLRKASDESKLPEAIKAPFLRQDSPNVLADNKALRAILESNVKESGADIKDVLRFAQIAAAYKVLSANPDDISPDQLTADVKKLSESLNKQVAEVSKLNAIMNEWHDAIGQIKEAEYDIDYEKDYYAPLIKDLDSFFDHSKFIDPEPTMKEMHKLMKKEYGRKLPPQLKSLFEGWKRAATSNETPRIRIMAKRVADYSELATRVAAYHGVIDQRGNPTDPPNTGWKSYDKRYFDEDNYKSIIKFAKNLLTQDWFKYGWGEKKSDANLRAALDIAIYTGDSTLHQSKIDSETYNMLLNRLAGWGYDPFSETIIFESGKGTKRSASMKAEIINLVRIANDMRKTNPEAAFEILKNVRRMAAGFEDAPEEPGVEGEPPPPKTSVDVGDLIKDALSEVTDEDPAKVAEAVEKELAKEILNIDAKSIEELMERFDEIHAEVTKGMEGAGGGTPGFASSLSVLVNAAYHIPALRPKLLPVIVAAKKRGKKKGKAQPKGKGKAQPKGKGKAQPKGKGKAPPFGGKQAPPFGGKQAPPFGKDKDEKKTAKGKKTSKGKKRKASITAEDLNW